MLYSPINYAGNKSRIAKEIISIFPKDIDCLYDVFCGSGIIGILANSKKTVLNDMDINILNLINYFKNTHPEVIIKETDKIIKKYGLTNTYYEGKESYPIEKNEGLSKHNKEAFLRLRNDYNNDKNISKLFTLVIYSFNHYLRFNKKSEYNVPVGKTDFVKSLREKTITYSKALKSKEFKICNLDFRNESLYKSGTSSDFFYFDPPYLITQAPYNVSWAESDEVDLLNKLDYLNDKGFRFALSNVVESNGKENKILKNWMKKYKVHYIERRYLNSNYRKKNLSNAVEVLIVNY